MSSLGNTREIRLAVDLGWSNDVGCSLLLSIGEFADEQISLSVDGT
jgi:hypothetical protein